MDARWRGPIRDSRLQRGKERLFFKMWLKRLSHADVGPVMRWNLKAVALYKHRETERTFLETVVYINPSEVKTGMISVYENALSIVHSVASGLFPSLSQC